MEPSETTQLRHIFADIVRGFSIGLFQSNPVYIKHFGLFDQVDLDEYGKVAFNKAKTIGVLTLEDTLARLKRRGEWVDSDEIDLAQKKSYLGQLEKTLEKLDLIADREAMKVTIQEAKMEYLDRYLAKENLIGMTCEKYSNTRVNNYFIFKSFYRGSNLLEPLFSETAFDDTDDDTIQELIKCYNKAVNSINTENLKKISLCYFFQNSFYLAETPYEYWGKRIVDLTLHQSELSSLGRYYKHLLQNNPNIPDEIRLDPVKLVEFIEGRNSMKEAMSGEGSYSRAGATKEDYAKMGLKVDNALAKKARELGRALTSIEMANIEGATRI